MHLPRAFRHRTLARDPGERTESRTETGPRGLLRTETPPLTRPGQSATSIVASVDRSEDPLDLYRVWAPAHRVLRAHVNGPVAVRVLPRAPQTKNAVPLAAGKHGTAAYRNAASQGRYVYVEVRPAGARSTRYTLHLTVARR